MQKIIIMEEEKRLEERGTTTHEHGEHGEHHEHHEHGEHHHHHHHSSTHHHHHHSSKKKTPLSRNRNLLWILIPVTILFVLFLIYLLNHPDALKRFQSNVSFYEESVAYNGKYDGIDISHHQGIIDWETVSQHSDLKFVYIKATEGSTFIDSVYQRNIAEAKRVGLKVGSYHFFRYTSPVYLQFLNFIETVDVSQQDLLPMVDVEWLGVRGWRKEQLQDSLALFISMIKEHFGADPIIYADIKFYTERLSPRFDKYPLFIAHYEKDQPIVQGADRHYIWQRDEHGHIDGIPKEVDLDVFAKGTTLNDILLIPME